MAVYGLADYLRRDPHPSLDGSCPLWSVYSSFYTPGFWVSLAAYARNNGIKYEDIEFDDDEHKGYGAAIGLPAALGESDKYPFARRNEGLNYSGLVLLENAEATDRATNDVNGCIRNLCKGLGVDQFAKDLCEVVGDVHDNVWSHGKSTGFSMAQRWRKPGTDEHLFEFALADCGYGFLRELRRVGLDVADDKEAIQWCITKGNSSKLVREPRDDWDQRLPIDIVGNPMPSAGRVKESENHHQGLGLAKLVSLVEGYKGNLWLATGNDIFAVNSDGRRSFLAPSFRWPGVSIACRFDTSLIRSSQKTEEIDEVTSALIDLLEDRR